MFRALLLSLFLCILSAAWHPACAQAPSDSLKLKIPTDTSAFCIVEMKDGLLLKGRVIRREGENIYFRDNNLGLVTIKTGRISFIEQGSSNMYFLFCMKDGALLHGKIVSQNETQIEIETKSMGRQAIPMERIKEMRKIEEKDIRRRGKYWYPNMNASRYFFGPSAIPQKEGEGYYQTIDFVLNNFNFGLTKNFTLGGGAVLPFVIFIMPKYGKQVQERLFVGGGGLYAQTIIKFRKTNYKLGALYGLATFGNHNNNFSFGAGLAVSDVNNETIFYPKPVVIISGTLRISRRVALVGENVVIPYRTSFYTAEGKVYEFNHKNSSIYGLRFMKERASLGFGLLHYPQDIFKAFPYLDFAIKI